MFVDFWWLLPYVLRTFYVTIIIFMEIYQFPVIFFCKRIILIDPILFFKLNIVIIRIKMLPIPQHCPHAFFVGMLVPVCRFLVTSILCFKTRDDPLQ